jgi:penicillin-binding protein 2
MNPAEIVQMVKKSRYQNGPFLPVRIKDNLSLDQVYRLKLLRWDHPGLNVNEIILRYYPLAENGAQLFGYVGEISKEQLDRFNQKYQGLFNFDQGDIIGKSGLEEVWERYLRGEDGVSYVEVDARGREAPTETPSFLGFEEKEEIPGNNLVLTIDKDVQEAAFKAMDRDDAIGRRTGALVAMKSNGEILAWVNEPSFDPNQFATGISSQLWNKLINDPFRPLKNKVIQDHYSPGSTFKPIMALAALHEGVITPNTIVSSPGSIKFGRRVYHDHLRGGHGNIRLYDALERSSNVFFYKMGIALGIDRIAPFAKALGLGSRTNINLGNEVPGLIPTKEWKLKALGEEWQPGENLSTAIGQGFVLATALQMAVAYNAIGLEGKVVKPRLVRKILSPDNKLIKEMKDDMVRDLSKPNDTGLVISKTTFDAVKEGMRRVANGARGTARWWKIPGVEMAGKTGTSQVMNFSAEQIYDRCDLRPIFQRHNGWFIAYAPADKPEITVAVLAEHACHGNMGGAPVVRDVIKAFMEKYHPERLKMAGKHPHPKDVTPSTEEIGTQE